jgi:cytochrome b pre-mRNA-processing protein 3
MSIEYLNIYNNLIKLTRNKNLYLNLKNKDTFSDRLIILLFHFGFFLQFYKDEATKKDSQNLFDYVIKQIELSIREIGYGDVSINKKMKDYVNLFYLILEKIEKWHSLEKSKKTNLIADLINIDRDNDLLANYFDKYREFLINNPLKNFRKDIIEFKF